MRFVPVLLLALLAPSLLQSERARRPRIEKDIVYGKGVGEELKLDLARPNKGEGPFPLVVCLHGGGWQIGQRSAHHGTIRMLAEHGYVAATVTYRLTPKHKFPAQIEDAK